MFVFPLRVEFAPFADEHTENEWKRTGRTALTAPILYSIESVQVAWLEGSRIEWVSRRRTYESPALIVKDGLNGRTHSPQQVERGDVWRYQTAALVA